MCYIHCYEKLSKIVKKKKNKKRKHFNGQKLKLLWDKGEFLSNSCFWKSGKADPDYTNIGKSPLNKTLTNLELFLAGVHWPQHEKYV